MKTELIKKSLKSTLIIPLIFYIILPPIFTILLTIFNQLNAPQPIEETGRIVGAGQYVCQYRGNSEGYCDRTTFSGQTILGIFLSIPMTVYLGYLLFGNFQLFIWINLAVLLVIFSVFYFYYERKEKPNNIPDKSV